MSLAMDYSLDKNSEKEIVLGVSRGDEKAFRCLFDLYRRKIYSFALYITHSEFLAEEIVQDVFMKIWQNREQLCCVDYLNAYLKSIAKNEAINYLKRMAMEKLILNKMAMMASESEDHSEPVVYNDLRKILDEAINSLPPQQKRVYTLHRLENMKQEKIAQTMEISLYTVKEYMKKASCHVRSYMEARIHLIVASALFLFFD